MITIQSKFRRTAMTTTLTIKDLALDKELGCAAMATVRGGFANQANGTQQGNMMGLFAPVAVANGANFSGSGPVIIQVDSFPTQWASNSSSSSNSQGSGLGWDEGYRDL
jgi:hypothetical protein